MSVKFKVKVKKKSQRNSKKKRKLQKNFKNCNLTILGKLNQSIAELQDAYDVFDTILWFIFQLRLNLDCLDNFCPLATLSNLHKLKMAVFHVFFYTFFQI